MRLSSGRALGGALLALITGAVAVAPAAAQSYAARVRESQLPNGLKLILLEDHTAPVAVFQIWYRVGSRNEALGHTGLSHLLEHMMFKGTPKVAPEEYSRIIQSNGGQTNAFTSQDYTTYFATMASDRLGVVIDLEADRMSHLIIDAALFDPERAVVAEERRLRVDNNPVAAMFEQLGATAYAAHPYQFPIIGWMSDIEQSTADDLRRWYQSYYVPNNAFVVVVGDFSADRLGPELETAFAANPRGPDPPAVRSIEPRQQGARRVEVRRPAELPFVAISYHVPNLYSSDGVALEVLEEMLGGGKSARLYSELVYRRRLAHDVGASYDYTSRNPGLFTVYAQPLPGKSAAELEKALLAEIEKIKQASPHDSEVQKARNGIEASFVFAQDSLFYQGLLLGQYEIVGDWRLLDTYLPAIRAVTGADVTRVAWAYLTADNRTVGTLVNLPTTGERPVAGAVPMGPLQ